MAVGVESLSPAAAHQKKASCSELRAFKDDFRSVDNFYFRGKVLGRGGAGTVRWCVCRRTFEFFACKSVDKTTLRDLSGLRREVLFLHAMRNDPGVVHLHDVFEDEREVHLVMELCPHGDLYDLVERGCVGEKSAAKVCASLASALGRCHANGIMHRDVKLENVMLSSESGCDDVKLVDFGVACRIEPGKRMSTITGTPVYMAPEVLHGNYGPEADTWSLGVVLYSLLFRDVPFDGKTDQDVFRCILNDDLMFPKDHNVSASSEALDLLRRLLDKNPNTRIKLQDVLRHPFVLKGTQGNAMADRARLRSATNECMLACARCS